MIPASVRVFVCTAPQDMRRGFDMLAQVVRQEMGGDPRSGDLFVFTSRGSDRLKMLWWDHNGFALMYKRLSGARVRGPAATAGRVVEIDGRELAAMMRGTPRPAKRGTNDRA
ncbi:MAG TPA: IS66 family insertion sequence element accessory protein TnpB [Solirubrobacteraceae bacterium]|nr:IS66 family insertion sequence element accessory protein TnpB [Solirubrobacteraceae bacterium]